jgi:hypothetical protein
MKRELLELLDRLVVLLWIYIPVEEDEDLRMGNIINPLYWVFIAVVLFIALCIQMFKELLSLYVEIIEGDMKSFSIKRLWRSIKTRR